MADRSDIDEVLARTDIVSVIEQYVTLKRAGRSFKGLCPFHQEKTPSFTVNPDIGPLALLRAVQRGRRRVQVRPEDREPVVPRSPGAAGAARGRHAADQFGAAARRGGGERPAASPEAGERDRLYRINALALDYYRDMLARSPEAQDYLRERGLAHATQEAFSLGFAPDAWDGLATFLTRKAWRWPMPSGPGLVSKSDRGGYYDKLRGRLIFPIFDVQERPIAFGGRLLGEAEPGQPKYWNSPETPVFSKSKTLYGLWRARKAIAARGQAVVVEGYTDVIAAHQAGFEYVVATLGHVADRRACPDSGPAGADRAAGL